MEANREGKALFTLAHLRGDIMNTFNYTYEQGEAALNGGKESIILKTSKPG